jgi:RNA polymerase sigma-70 factor (ECF subfamily)
MPSSHAASAPHANPPGELADEEIARRVVAGEGELFELLMRRYNQRLFRVARVVVDDDAEAEDVVQDAWVRAYEHLAGFRGEARLSTWLTRIALHEAWSRLRRRRRHVALLPDEESAAPVADERPGPEQRAAARELRTALETAVAQLPPAARTAFLLRDVEGLSTEETAELLELSPGAVKVRLHRARARLRAEIDRRLGAAASDLYHFAGHRCDRIVERVFARLELGAHRQAPPAGTPQR